MAKEHVKLKSNPPTVKLCFTCKRIHSRLTDYCVKCELTATDTKRALKLLDSEYNKLLRKHKGL